MELGYIKIENDIVIDACDNALSVFSNKYSMESQLNALRLVRMSSIRRMFLYGIWKRPKNVQDAIHFIKNSTYNHRHVSYEHKVGTIRDIKWLVKMSIASGGKYVYLSSKSVDYIKNYIGKADYNEL